MSPVSSSLPDRIAKALHATFPGDYHEDHHGECRPCDERTKAVMPVIEPELAETALLRQVLTLFAAADCHGLLWWRVDGGQISLFAMCSDVFAWARADAEEITVDRLPVLQQAYDDLKAVGGLDYLPELYASRVRELRPQGAAYPKDSKVAALFDECGPRRETGLDKTPGEVASEQRQRADQAEAALERVRELAEAWRTKTHPTLEGRYEACADELEAALDPPQEKP